MREAAIIGVASGWGARDRGCEDGPRVLQESGILHCVAHPDQGPPAFEILHADESRHGEDALRRVVDIDQRLAERVTAQRAQGRFPVVVDGDHVCAVGTWSGVRASLRLGQALGLIWVDAHMDSHVPATSPSGALHGMPLACLLGYGEPSLTGLGGAKSPKLRPEHVCLIGVRSCETGERTLLERLGVRIVYMAEVRERGLQAVWDEAVRIATRGTAGYGVTIDLDGMDPRDAPGVGTPVSAGIAALDLIQALRSTHGDTRLLAVELAEYNPHADHDRLTLRLLRRLICAAVAGKERDE